MKLTDKELHHLDTVIRYLHSDELKDYENEGRPPDHIFTSVLGLQEILRRETPAPQPSKLAEEVASRPGDWAKDLAAPDNGTGDPRAGSPIGIVRDHPSHDEDTSTKHLIIWALLPLAKLPDTVANLVKDAVHGDLDEQCRAALAAVDAIARRRREPDADIPF